MKNIFFTGIVVSLLFSCSLTKETPHFNEISKILKAYGKLSNEPRLLYYKSLDIHGNFEDQWKVQIKHPQRMIIDIYNKKRYKKWKTVLDSLLRKIPDTLFEERTKIKDSIADEFRINPEKLFTSTDIKFMLYQFQDLKVIKWRYFGQKKNIKITRSRDARRISVPIFSKNCDMAILFIEYPSYKALEVFKKTDNRWEFYFHSTLVIYD